MEAGDYISINHNAFGEYPIFGKVIEIDDVYDSVLIKVFHECIWVSRDECHVI